MMMGLVKFSHCRGKLPIVQTKNGMLAQMPPLFHCLKRFSVLVMLVELIGWFSQKHAKIMYGTNIGLPTLHLMNSTPENLTLF
ncbi:hypothetical protein M8C21_020008, partial [Ambrosia artemisiifolia]